MSDDQNGVVTLKVRVTPEFREKIVEIAKSNNRSMNAEIVHRLEQSLALYPEDHPINMSPDELLRRTTQTVAKEVIDEFVRKLKNNEFKDVGLELHELKKAP